jgi:hypothetical protein
MGVVGSELVYAVYIAFQHERSFILQTLRMAFQPLAAGLLTAIVLSVIQLPWGLTVLVGLIVYTAVLLGVGEFSVDGRKLVKAFRGFFTER